MALLEYQDLTFRQDAETVRVVFLKQFGFDLPLDAFRGLRVAGEHAIEAESEKSGRLKLGRLLEQGFSRMKSILTGRKAVYIHRNSGIPLIGSQYFGLVDRNTNIVELRPITGCNLSCTYCSVDEGPLGRKLTDFVVEERYLVQEFKRLVEFKECDDIEAHINPQGEPLLYAPLPELVSDLKALPQVKRISIDTNGTLLTKQLIDDLAAAGLTQFNVSINSFSQQAADTLAGCHYDVKHVLSMIEYALPRMKVLIAPMLIPGQNEDFADVFRFAKKHGIRVGIQNFLEYPGGRNPVRGKDMENFRAMLAGWEKEYGLKLSLSAEDFGIHKTKELPVPFRKGERLDVKAVCPGRLKGESLAVAKDRVISIRSNSKRIEIVRTKHNIIIGK
jgi:uncharacterized protein